MPYNSGFTSLRVVWLRGTLNENVARASGLIVHAAPAITCNQEKRESVHVFVFVLKIISRCVEGIASGFILLFSNVLNCRLPKTNPFTRRCSHVQEENVRPSVTRRASPDSILLYLQTSGALLVVMLCKLLFHTFRFDIFSTVSHGWMKSFSHTVRRRGLKLHDHRIVIDKLFAPQSSSSNQNYAQFKQIMSVTNEKLQQTIIARFSNWQASKLLRL